MIEELVKEKRKQRDQEETQKIMNAIHEQAYWKKVELENKRIQANIDKELKKDTKKEVKHQLKEELICFPLLVVSLIPIITLLIVLCY